MKAFVYTRYGPPDVLELKEVEKPAPKENQVLVKIHAASVNALDWHLLTAQPFVVRLMGEGLLKPKKNFIGADFAGVVETAGEQVTQFKPGDEVFGDLAGTPYGSFGEYAVGSEKIMAPKPANLSFEEAAAAPVAGVTALQALRDAGKVQPGQKVLIYGAAGGVGTFTVQLAKVFGAEVTAVCSTAKVEQTRRLGADEVIDYTREDITRSSQRFDLIVGVNGYRSLSDYKRMLKPGGRYVMAGGSNGQIFQAMLFGSWMSRGDKKMGNVMATIKQADLLTLKELLEAGKITAVIERRYPLSEAPEAVRYVYEGHAAGKVVINIA